MLEFVKTCQRKITVASRQRIWQSCCGRFRVVHSRCLYGPRKGPQAIPDTYYAERRDPVTGSWDILSRHRKREPALRACQQAAREDDS